MEDYFLDTKKDYTVIVPVHNSEEVLVELFQRIFDTLINFSQNFEVIFVDDYSKDNSWKVIKSLKEKYPQKVKGIRLSKNYGQHNATLCGIKHANANVVITIDDDLEFYPEDISLLIDRYSTNQSDVVYGVDEQKKMNRWRSLLTRVFRKMQAVAHKGNIKGSSFRLIKGDVAVAITKNAREFSFIDEFLGWHTSAIAIVTIKTSESRVKSRYKIKGLMGMTKNLIFLSSTVPLRLVTSFGFLMMALNFIAGVIVIYRRLVLTIDVKGFTSIVVAILFSSGAIIFCIGVVAEYIGKILKMSYNKPAFFESEVL